MGLVLMLSVAGIWTTYDVGVVAENCHSEKLE
jgi:hypothetical protein